MDKAADLEKKYNVIALEYSKVRSQATVLKKAVLDEQSRSAELRDTIKKFEQKIRKHEQEMDSLTFRNEQLTKRIAVLQQELQVNNHGKKSKQKHSESTGHVDYGLLDEELHKKILENAQLVSTMADKDLEIESNAERTQWLENKISHLQKELNDSETKYNKEIEKLKKQIVTLKANKAYTNNESPLKVKEQGQGDNMSIYWQQEAERWRTECELLRSKPEANEQITDYFELQVRELIESKQLAQSETSSLLAENLSLKARVEQLILEKNHLEHSILTNVDELHTTSDNYRSQLDAMTEHLATQNEKITTQCDEIQVLRHRLSTKK